MFVCVALTRGRVIASSLPTVTPMVQRAVPLPEVTPSLLCSRKIYKKTRNPESILKLKLGKKWGSGYLVQDAKGVRAYISGWDVLLLKRA